ncbi:MAG: hypothetical protein ABL953_13685 [Ilumatobacteraceae bacterium]
MTWTQERIASALSDLDAPKVDEAFWNRVRADLLRESDGDEVRVVMSPSDRPMATVHALVRSPWRVRWYVAASAVLAVLIAGLYAVGRSADPSPAASPRPADVVLTDLLSLSLDDLPRTGEPAVSESDYVVPDLAELPDGWTATLDSAFGIMQPPGRYVSYYSLVSPTGISYSVNVTAGLPPMPESGETVDINGHSGWQENNHVWWEQEPDVLVAVTRERTVAPDETELTLAARSLSFASVTELPIVAIDPNAVPPTKVAQFAGTLNGIRYAVQARTGPLRGIWVYAGDQAGAGVAEDRLSQPTDDPQTAGSVNIAGVAGYGVIVFGYTEPATAGLRANLADGSTIQVPVLRNPGETYFALPIPLGVEVVTLDFLDVDGGTLRTATMPTDLPAYFGHCCASAEWTTS